MQENLKQPFVIENRPGAGTTTGIAAAASATPDGYTILFSTAAMTTTPVTMAQLAYDVGRDLAGVIPLVNTPLVMVAPAGRYASVQDFVAKAKAAPGTLNYAVIGYGAAAHFASCALFGTRATAYVKLPGIRHTDVRNGDRMDAPDSKSP